jgi:hypothetical protein
MGRSGYALCVITTEQRLWGHRRNGDVGQSQRSLRRGSGFIENVGVFGGGNVPALLRHKSPDMTALSRDVRGSEWIEIRLG